MRKQLLTILTGLLTGAAGAQTQKGNGLISSSLAVNYSRSTDKRTDSYLYHWQPELNLTAGRFVADNWLLGLSVAGSTGFSRSVGPLFGNQASTQSQSRVSVTTTPLIRRYWRFAPVLAYAGAGVAVGISGSRQTGQEVIGTALRPAPTQHTTGLTADPYLEAGLTYFLTNRLSIDLKATARSLPFGAGGFGTGLTYWTGSDRKHAAQPERDNPQTKPGNWLVEGRFFVDNQRTRQSENNLTNDFRGRQYSLSPAVGYFVRDNSLLGISIPLTISHYENTNQNPSGTSTTNLWTVGVSPYYQHYWSSTRLTPYTRIDATYLMSGSTANDYRQRVVSAGLTLGLAYMAGQRFIIETSLANAGFGYEIPGESGPVIRSWSANVSAGLSGNFAVRYVFTRTK